MRNGRHPTAVIQLCSALIACLASPLAAQNTAPVQTNLNDNQQPAIANQAVGNPALLNPGVQQPPTQPFPELSPEHIKYIDDLLGIWEQNCRLKRTRLFWCHHAVGNDDDHVTGLYPTSCWTIETHLP